MKKMNIANIIRTPYSGLIPRKIAVVVPTIRPAQFADFMAAWADLFQEHRVELVVVEDGETPILSWNDHHLTVKDVMGKDAALIYNRTDACRNLGFAFVARFLPHVEYIISLDDDTKPEGDTIQAHIDALQAKVSISWVSTIEGHSMRGIPYNTREEAQVMLSHGWWKGVPDLDAPTQLISGIPKEYKAVRGPIPKGTLFPLCAMNFAFRRDALPYAYQAPMNTHGMDRFADIWCGITLKREFDRLGWAVYTGHACVRHERASNVFTNLRKEAKGLGLNETFWKDDMKDPYFKLYTQRYGQWKRFINKYIKK